MKTILLIILFCSLFFISYVHFYWLERLIDSQLSQARIISEIISKLDQQYKFNHKIANTFRNGNVPGWKVKKKYYKGDINGLL